MKISTIHEIYSLLTDDNLSFIYQGQFSNPVLNMATDLIKNHLESDSNFTSLRNKLSFLMVESFQNIVRYSDSHRIPATSLGHEMFMTRNHGETFYIFTANLIENSKVEYVKDRLEKVNTLDDDELKKFYVQVLTDKKINDQGGAGLGFIEMVRKSKEKLEFSFVKVNDEISCFYFQIKLKGKEIEEHKSHSLSFLDEAQRIHELVSSDNILVVHKGNFSQDAILPVLVMVESNVQKQVITTQKRVFHMMVEVMQNISKHAKLMNNHREGIFILSQQDSHYYISTGNFIDNSTVVNVKNHLDTLNKMDKKNLDDFYRRVLRDGNSQSDDANSGLGLIDIAREATDKIKYEIIPVTETYSFFSLLIKL